MHIVLSFFSTRPVEGLERNHAGYAQAHGYEHVVVDGTSVFGERQGVLHRYHAIYQQLLRLPDGGLLLVLDAFSVVYAPHDLAAVAQGHDAVVSSQGQEVALPTPSGMILRATPEIRERVRALVLRLSRWAMYLPDCTAMAEVELLGQAFPVHPFHERLRSGHFASVQTVWQNGSALDSLHDAAPLVAHNAPEWERRDGLWRPSPSYDFRYVQALLEEASARASGTPLRPAQASEAAARAERAPALHLNEGAQIAFVTLHTHHIAGYADLHERSLSAYCRRHGYAYHAYREAPGFLPGDLRASAGNWAKAHLVRHHLPQHEFVFWIDADILAVDQAQPVEPLVADREFIIGTDHCAWPVNSCMFGLRRTPAMQHLADRMCERIESTPDRSSVYASGGDQQLIMETLMEFGMIDARHVVDAMTLGVSPIYATRSHRFVHFPAQLNHYRAVTMAVWDRWSTRACGDGPAAA